MPIESTPFIQGRGPAAAAGRDDSDNYDLTFDISAAVIIISPKTVFEAPPADATLVHKAHARGVEMSLYNYRPIDRFLENHRRDLYVHVRYTLQPHQSGSQLSGVVYHVHNAKLTTELWVALFTLVEIAPKCDMDGLTTAQSAMGNQTVVVKVYEDLVLLKVLDPSDLSYYALEAFLTSPKVRRRIAYHMTDIRPLTDEAIARYFQYE